MSLFVGEETIKLYIENGRIVEHETQDWVEVIKEPPAGLVEKAVKAIRPNELYVSRDGSARIKLDDVEEIPYFYLASVIKAWSESVPISPETLQKLPYRLLRAIWMKIQELHGLGGESASGI